MGRSKRKLECIRKEEAYKILLKDLQTQVKGRT